MIGRGANLNKLRRQAEGKSKAKVPSKTIQPNIMTPSAIVSNQPTVSSGAVILEPMDNTPSLITTPQDLRNVLSPMSPVEIDNINPEPEDPESGRFLASLIAQGAAGFGAGMMGGSSQDILRATGMFDRMRESDINRQDRLKQSELLRTERLGEKQERLAEIKKREDQAKSLTDPNSEESKRKREVYKSLGFQVPNNLSATDLNDPTVLQTLKGQMEQSRLASMPRGGIGVGGAGRTREEQPKERKLSQDERQLLNNSAMAYKALFDLEDAIKRKVPKVTALGDNDYTFAANRFSEGLGRMQSGGAIGIDEEKKFLKLIPGSFDSEETANKKIKTMKTDLEARLRSIGYDPKTILESRSYTDEEISPSEQDQAIKWANENINSKDETKRLQAEKILRGK